ncbi:protoglobin domain-containing protein [Bacillus sp. JCM 19041]|uniref:protoglobin domain-containing protein n=1 Tax=Bacillus sp. JCM 19041 TaxID=1460637 RepID=UPI0018D0D860
MDTEKGQGGIVVTNKVVQSQLEFINLTEKDVAYIQVLRPLIEEHILEITNAFYDKLLQQPEMNELIRTYSTVAALKRTFNDHILELFNGTINEEFLEKRKRIALAHVRIGLKTSWYIGAFSHLQFTLNQIIVNQLDLGSDKFLAISAVGKYINFEQQLVLEAYERENERIRLAFSDKRDRYINEVRNAVRDISQIAEETDGTANKAALQSQEIQALTVAGGKNAASSLNVSAKGKEQLLKQNGQMEEIYVDTEKIVSRMDELLLLSDGVKEVIDIVKRIADQTNLLSINASIEAEQAGERGKGFAVVASEIRKLSNQTKDSTKRVSDLINTMNEQSTYVGKSVSKVMEAVRSGAEGMKATEERFDLIVSYVEENRSNLRILRKASRT